MILRRLGNKKKIAKKIQQYFLPHKIYIESFFGAGGMFFNKQKSKYNIVNDIDSDVFNLFMVVMNQKEELEKLFYKMPIHSDLLKYWIKNKETDLIKKAIRFLFLSNLTYMGTGSILQAGLGNTKESFYKLIQLTHEKLNGVKFFNNDYKKFIECLAISKDDINPSEALIYSDSPYLETNNNYFGVKGWTRRDVVRLFDCLQATTCNFALSEFDHPFILKQAKERNLNIITIGKRRNLKNERIEILITNYDSLQMSLFD